MDVEHSRSISLTGSIQFIFPKTGIDVSISSAKDVNVIPKLEFGSIIEDSARPNRQAAEQDQNKIISIDYPDDDTECDVKDYAELNDVTDRTGRFLVEEESKKPDADRNPQNISDQMNTGNQCSNQQYEGNNNDDMSALEMHLMEMGDETEELRQQIRKLKQENQDLKNDCLDALDQNFHLQNNFVSRKQSSVSMDPENENEETSTNQTNSFTSYSLLNHEKEILLQKTKSQENELMVLRLKVDAYESEKRDNNAFAPDEKESMEKEISALRGKVALFERNNRLFSNQERQILKQDLERTKRRYAHLNDQYTWLKNSTESQHISQVEMALADHMEKVRRLEEENVRLKNKRTPKQENINMENKYCDSSSDIENQVKSFLEEKEEIIKDQNVMIDELEHRIEFMKTNKRSRSPSKSKSSFESREKLSARSSSRGRRARSKEGSNQSDSSSEQYSDSDARAIRALSGRMRQDIEEAKQKLKDMGEALEVHPLVSPVHFPPKTIFSSRMSEERDVHKDLSSSQSKKRTLSLPSMVIDDDDDDDDDDTIREPTNNSKAITLSSISKSKQTASWSSSPKHHATPGTTHNINSITPKEQTKERIRTFPKVAKERGPTMNSKPRKTYKSYSSPASIHHNSEYELLKILSLDYKMMEVEIECIRQDYESTKQKAHAVKRRETGNFKKKIKQTVLGTTEDLSHHNEKPTSKYLPGNHEVLQPNHIEISDNLWSSSYRVYVVKRDHIPNHQDSNNKRFPELTIHAGDVVFSLGAPEDHGDGNKLQLAEVDGLIGYVPLGLLQDAQQVKPTGKTSGKQNAQLSNTQRRIADVMRKLHDKRRPMYYGL